MKERAERIHNEENDAGKSEERRSADIIDINRAALEKELDDFAEYKALKTGHLTLAEYQRIMKSARNPDTNNESLFAHAQAAANLAGITLSRQELPLYSALLSDRDLLSDSLHGDQQRLAEVLRITGRIEDLQVLIRNHPNIKF